MHLTMLSAKYHPFFLVPNVLNRKHVTLEIVVQNGAKSFKFKQLEDYKLTQTSISQAEKR